ncbi:PRTRC system ThiF family protein (plasmid) [Cupriavidus basilensis]
MRQQFGAQRMGQLLVDQRIDRDVPRLRFGLCGRAEAGHSVHHHATELAGGEFDGLADRGRHAQWPDAIADRQVVARLNRIPELAGTRWVAQTRRIAGTDRLDCDLAVGCVDTRSARKAILGAVSRGSGGYYLDCGNETDKGQVILGQVGSKIAQRLPHVGDLFPDLVNPKGDKADTAPSCSMADALRKQSLVINQAIGVQAFNLLWTLFRTGTLKYSGVFVNLEAGRTNPLPVDPAAWARFGYEPKQPAARKRAKK